MRKLSQEFFAGNTTTVARNLLGKIIVLNGCKARIVETEAYKQDKASHAVVKTDRSALMYDTYGNVYVYLIYGMYYCLNFTAEKNGVGAVLIRAAEPLEAIEDMKRRRGVEDLRNLCSGPGKLCQAFGINKNHNGLQLGEEIALYDDGFIIEDEAIVADGRIGIKEDAHLPWRFFLKNNVFVSKGKVIK